MSNGFIFRKYHRHLNRLEREINDPETSPERLTELTEIRIRCYPTKEEVVEIMDEFYDIKSGQLP